jgi:hypothetical protein
MFMNGEFDESLGYFQKVEPWRPAFFSAAAIFLGSQGTSSSVVPGFLRS